MKYSKAVYVAVDDIRGNFNRKNDQLQTHCDSNKDFTCQFDSKEHNMTCTCKKTVTKESRYFKSRHLYKTQRYSPERDCADVGVGDVKAIPRKRARRVYLADTKDRGVGSSDLTSLIRKPRHWTTNYYDQKKTSSKCVGGVIECTNMSVLSEKLSPIRQSKSGSTSPNWDTFKENDNNQSILTDTSDNFCIIKKREVTTDNNKKINVTKVAQETTHTKKTDEVSLLNTDMIKPTLPVVVDNENDFSSDSLVQHVHNLEKSSSFKHSELSIDINENKLGKEYTKMFTNNSKEPNMNGVTENVQYHNSKSISFTRKRFDVLRHGLSKSKLSEEPSVTHKSSSDNSEPNTKDVSISSDPPSLEARSYTNIKMYSPLPSSLHKYEDIPQISHRKYVTGSKGNSDYSTDVIDSNYQNCKGMFKLWGEKFNLEDDHNKKPAPSTVPDATKKQKKKVELILPKEENMHGEKKGAKRFSFFKKKNKDKSKQSHKSKKGVTAGRCELGDGLTIRIGALNESSKRKYEKTKEEHNDVLRNTWLQRFIVNNNDSRSCMNVRWNNEMYATSSSTIFDLMECIYKNTGIVFRSKSEVASTTTPSSISETPNYRCRNPRVNFMQQTIQAWMIPEIITDNLKREMKTSIEITYSAHKWFIDKPKAISQDIELVLHSNVKDDEAKSSGYIVIDIPKGYFYESCSNEEQSHTSDEQVYNIVEYETAKPSSYTKNDRTIDHDDVEANDVCLTTNYKDIMDKKSDVLETIIKTPPLLRDVVVQGSNVYVPKRCDVVGIRIITQHTHNSAMRDIKSPKLKNVQDEITDDESMHAISPREKCELTESNLQDYYRHWTPLGEDLYSWFFSDSNLRGSSINSLNYLKKQGDVSKSCPNIYEDYQTSALVTSCDTSSCSQCVIIEGTKKVDENKTAWFRKIKRKSDKQPLLGADGKRVLPKDSVEVCKRRKIYAASKKKDCNANDDQSKPISVPSILDKFAQKTSKESCDGKHFDNTKAKKKVKKRVSLKDFDLMKKIGDGMVSLKDSLGCNNCKKKEKCSKHARVNPDPTEMHTTPPESVCIKSCIKHKKSPCSKQNSPRCPVQTSPTCPADSPSCMSSRLPIASPCVSNPTRSPSSSCASPRTTSHGKIFSQNTTSPIDQLGSSCMKHKEQSYSKKSSASPSSSFLKCSKQPVVRSCDLGQNQSPTPSSKSSAAWHPKPLTSLPKCPLCCKKSLPEQRTSQSSSPSLNESCGCSSQKSCGLPQCHILPWPLPSQFSPKNSQGCLKKLTANGLSAATQKCNSSTINTESDCDFDCPKNDTRANSASQSKITGVHIKIKPAAHKSKENQFKCSVIPLNSKEHITVRLKPHTPSTEEIREGCNIKVQDEDGQTLYERRECKIDTGKTRKRLLTDINTNSQIHRVTTSKADINEKKLGPCESDTSLSNIVEINFNIKFTKADKERVNSIINGNQKENVPNQVSKNIYVVQDETKEAFVDTQKDVNIKIIINNYKENSNKSNTILNNLQDNDKFNRNISEKFRTVSTCYSDVIDQLSYSIHRTTLNFCNSPNKDPATPNEEIIKIQLSERNPNLSDTETITKDSKFPCSASLVAVNSNNFTDINKHSVKPSDEITKVNDINKDPINLTDSTIIAKYSKFQCSATSEKTSKILNIEVLPKDISQVESSEIRSECTLDAYDEKCATDISATDNEEALLSDVQLTDIIIPKIRNKEQKKKILKQIFENPNNNDKVSDKSKMQSVLEMLRAVLTSDTSAYDDVAINEKYLNELKILKPDLIKYTDSTTDCCNDSSMSENGPSQNKIKEILNPTKQNSMLKTALSGNESSRCLCSHIAAKLNVCGNNNFKPCCCAEIDKTDEEINCNLLEAGKIDVQTQDSNVKMKFETTPVMNASHSEAIQTQEIKDIKKQFKVFNKIPKRMYSFAKTIKACSIKKINRQSALAISDDDKIIIVNSDTDNSQNYKKNNEKIKPIDILQLHETKKAVLEIYAEKNGVNEDEHLVAKLPKFVYKRVNEICNYHEIRDYYQFSARNISMTSEI